MNRLIGGWRDGETVNCNVEIYKATKPSYVDLQHHEIAVRTTPILHAADYPDCEYRLRTINTKLEGVSVTVQAYFNVGIDVDDLEHEYLNTHEKLKWELANK